MAPKKVSVCISVRNGERYIAHMLDSLLVQSFDDFEVIIADNHSSDGTPEILAAYAAAFPEKVFVYKTVLHGGAGVGRNLAFEKSRGEYIWFCDADDLAHPRAIEVMYNAAIKYDADIVCASAWTLWEKANAPTEIRSFMKEDKSASHDEALRDGPYYFWNKLIRRRVLDAVGPMSWEHIFEDIRYVPLCIMKATTIRFISNQTYYYFVRSTSETFTVRKSLCTDVHKAWNDLFHVTDSPAVRLYAANALSWYILAEYWPYFDMHVESVRKHFEEFYRVGLSVEDPWAYGWLRWADHLPNNEVPPNIYVNGFTEVTDVSRMQELKTKVFHEGAEVVILSPENCENGNAYVRRAMEEGHAELAAKYFALKHIYERGGIYIGRRIIILNPFGYCKYQNAFFAALDERTYSDQIFGAPSGNEAIADILATFDDAWDPMHDFPTLAERIAMVLTAKYGIPLDGNPHLFGDVVSVFPPNLSAVDTRFGDAVKTAVFAHDFTDKANEAGYITLPKSTLSALLRDRKQAQEKARLDDPMFHGNLWKLFLFLRELSTKPYAPFLRKVFHALIWLRKKWKER